MQGGDGNRESLHKPAVNILLDIGKLHSESPISARTLDRDSKGHNGAGPFHQMITCQHSSSWDTAQSHQTLEIKYESRTERTDRAAKDSFVNHSEIFWRIELLSKLEMSSRWDAQLTQGGDLIFF